MRITFLTFTALLVLASPILPFGSLDGVPSVDAKMRELHPEFRIPDSGKLREKVDFWIQIYSKYGRTEGLLHDSKYPAVIYEVLDFSKSKKSRFEQTKIAKKRYRKILLSLHESGAEQDPTKYPALSEEERKVFDLYRNIYEPTKFLKASHFRRLRMQAGQKDAFLEGMKQAGRYLPYMEEVIIEKGLPFEISRLPYVESSFNTRARSKVGASGVWQFMRSTGEDFLVINEAIDERNDPIRASEAAAELLRVNHRSLATWPLAVTAYNHGRTALMRAVRRYGTTSLEQLFEQYKWRSFGFASSSFYACLLAAIEIDRNPSKYFGGPVDRERPLRYAEIPLPKGILLKDLIRFMGMNRKALIELNPAFTDEALMSQVAIPKAYRLRVLHDGRGTAGELKSQERVFLAGFRKIPKAYKR